MEQALSERLAANEAIDVQAAERQRQATERERQRQEGERRRLGDFAVTRCDGTEGPRSH